MTSPFYFLPTKGLPPTGYQANGRLSWIATDTEESYRKNRARSIYGDKDIEYRLNALGYRSPEFELSADVRIVAAGCSHVMGVGLPSAVLFHEQFANRLRESTDQSVVVWNIGVPGASNDHIARILHLALPFLDPDIVLVNFSHASRRDYVSVQGKWTPYVEGYNPPDLVGREIKGHFEALASPFDDELNVFRNYKSIERLLSDRAWLFSTVPHPRADPFRTLKDHFDADKYIGELPTLDLARDCSHCGPKSHQALADLYWERFCAGKLRSIG
jgi:hypothetical protein